MISPDALADTYRLEQARLAGRAATVALMVWQEFVDPLALDTAAPTLVELVGGAVQVLGEEASQSGAAFYTAHREALEVLGTAPLVRVLPDARAVATSLLVTGPIGVKQQVARGVPLADAMASAGNRLSGAAYRHVANAGRGTVAARVRADDSAVAFARRSDGNPCAFCKMLVGRGAVYKADTGRFTQTGSAYHDRCGCYVVPVYDAPARPRVRRRR